MDFEDSCLNCTPHTEKCREPQHVLMICNLLTIFSLSGSGTYTASLATLRKINILNRPMVHLTVFIHYQELTTAGKPTEHKGSALNEKNLERSPEGCREG